MSVTVATDQPDRDVGMRWFVGSTEQWPEDRALGPFYWSRWWAYPAAGTWQMAGFADSEQEAMAAVEGTLSPDAPADTRTARPS